MKIKGPTPVMKQFWNAKKDHPNSLMLFRMGDFYETFEEDAVLASDILGITLTKRANGAASSVPLAGFPYHSLEQHLHKLLKAGHRVAICEQVEDPKTAKGIVKREVIEVLSPGTALSEKYLQHNENNYLSAFIIDKNQIGFSLLDHSTGEFISGEIKSNQLNNIVKQFNISEAIVLEHQKEEFSTLLNNNNLFITEVPEWCESYDAAYDSLITHFNTQSLKGFGLDGKNLAITAAGVAFYYVNNNFKGRVKHINSISYYTDKNNMGLDSSTVRNLEIFKSLDSQGIHGTLIGTIDKTITSSGSRLLKKWLRHPLVNVGEINRRLKDVRNFLEDENARSELREILKETADMERILSKISTQKANPRDVVNLGLTLNCIIKIKEILFKPRSSIKKIINQFQETNKISQKILKTIKTEPAININKGGYIKDGVSKDLDEYRTLSNRASDWMIKMQLDEQKKTGISNLKVGYNRVFGYYLEVTKSHSDKVPDYYIRKQTLTNSERYFTEELKEYEEKILNSEQKIVEIETQILNTLFDQIISKGKEIQFNSIVLSTLDVLSTFAEIAIQNNYVFPIVNDKSKLELIDNRHPVIEKLLPFGDDFIGNDITIDNKKNQIAIITGPNMAGKSTYLRQIGLSVILAQVGSYVPAKKATIGVVDKLFTRVGASDNLAGGESTFLVEMNETANILNNATNKSLVLLDEIGRGTATYDGLSIAWSITEYLHNNPKVQSKTLFATHYHELVDLANKLKRAFNLNVAVKEEENEIIFLRKIILGSSDKSYGIHVAELAGLPSKVINRAHELLKELLLLHKNDSRPSIRDKKFKQIELTLEDEERLLKELKSIDINSLTPIDALKILNDLKNKYEK